MCDKERTGFHLIHFSTQLEKLTQLVQQNFGTEMGRQLTLTFKSCHVSLLVSRQYSLLGASDKWENNLLQYLQVNTQKLTIKTKRCHSSPNSEPNRETIELCLFCPTKPTLLIRCQCQAVCFVKYPGSLRQEDSCYNYYEIW